jgi:predicted Rossmann fold nucleotide-binding protein DprA/Smf involved in DNA uptake
MQRNKYIYALSDAVLVVDTKENEGGTWAGAQEQLKKLHYAPVYTEQGVSSDGLDALRRLGAKDISSTRLDLRLREFLNHLTFHREEKKSVESMQLGLFE